MTSIPLRSTVRLAPAFSRPEERHLDLTVSRVSGNEVTAVFRESGKVITVAAQALIVTERPRIIRMTETATGKVTYVTARGNAKARGRAHHYTAEAAVKFAQEYAETNPGYEFVTEAV
jgi:hypothetical protein